MQLKYDNQVKNEVITLELETTSFTTKERQALDRVGEPVISFEKLYDGKHPVLINKKIRSAFKIRVRFDGKDGILSASTAANQFLDEIKITLEEAMREAMDKAAELDMEFKPGSGFYDIT